MAEGQLTIDDVRGMLAASPPDARWLVGDDPGHKPGYDNTACLWRRADGSWFVAWFERGSYFDEQVFASESEACRAFLGLLGR
jgi:hypothetical protein